MAHTSTDEPTEAVTEARAAHARGWVLTQLRGKIPQLDGWQKREPPDLATVEAWAIAGNLGLRTGPVSGVVVVDEDVDGDLEKLFGGPVPWTITAITGSGKRHLYFEAPDPCPGNRARIDGLGVDLRGAGGQVVYPGSIHPQTRQPYRWADGLSPDDVPLAQVPTDLLERLTGATRAASPPPAAPPPDRITSYGRRALDEETARVLGAPEGARNDALNRAAFSLGQLVGGGVLGQDTVETELHRCALAAGLSEREASATVRSGLTRGVQQPRCPAPRAMRLVSNGAPTDPTDAADGKPPDVLIPGSHADDTGTYHEVGNDDFCEAVMVNLPEGLIYRRDDIAGEIVGPPGERTFRPLSVHRVRVLVDRHVSLCRWIKRQKDPDPVRVYQTCSRDHASVLLDSAGVHRRIRHLRLLVPYPTFLGSDYHLSTPGWNDGHGVYYDEPPELVDLETNYEPEDVFDTLADLVIDFPFRTEADKQNYYGLLLTPMLRPALGGNAPLHLILAPLERTGKSYLAATVLGGLLLGHATAAIQLSGSEEERDKRILSMLLGGSTIANVDNIRDYLDSACLASLLTTTAWTGRLLGHSRVVTAPNYLTLVGTGNNVRATGEIVKRTVPIQIQPLDDKPEERTDFVHPELAEYVASVRRKVLGCLVSMVSRWRDGERSSGAIPKGGFEKWSSVVGGILMLNAFAEWRKNEVRWARQSDPVGEDLRAFVEAWVDAGGASQAMRASDLMELCEANNLFPQFLKSTTEKGRQIAFARNVLSRYTDTPVAGYVIRAHGGAGYRMYVLEEQ